MIYTGYFAKTKFYTEQGLQVISIAGKAPDFFKGPKYPSLAPSYSMFMDWKKGRIDNMEYTSQFNKHLETLDKEAVRRFLTSFDKDIVLLCYEKTGDFCHRHIVADWIENELGMRVDEYDIDKINRYNIITEELKEYYLEYDDVKSNLTYIEFQSLLKDLEQNPPEGYFLFKEDYEDGDFDRGPWYTLKNKAEFLKDYEIEDSESLYERY